MPRTRYDPADDPARFALKEHCRIACDAGRPLETRLAALSNATPLRDLDPDRRRQLVEARAELARLVAEVGTVRAGGLEWFADLGGRLHCQVPTSDPHIREG